MNPLGPQPACGAKCRDGHPCLAFAVRGSKRCRMHGGNRHPEANRRQYAVAETKRACDMYGLPVETTPEDALMAEIDRTNGHVLFLEAKVQESREQDLIRRVITEASHGALDLRTYDLTRVEETIAVWLELLITERKHLATITASAIKLGLQARMVAQKEKEQARLAAQFVDTLMSILASAVPMVHGHPQAIGAAPGVIHVNGHK